MLVEQRHRKNSRKIIEIKNIKKQTHESDEN